MQDLFAIVRQSDQSILWAKVTDAEDAQQTAVIAAVNGGNMNLLSGADLGKHLIAQAVTEDSEVVKALELLRSLTGIDRSLVGFDGACNAVDAWHNERTVAGRNTAVGVALYEAREACVRAMAQTTSPKRIRELIELHNKIDSVKEKYSL